MAKKTKIEDTIPIKIKDLSYLRVKRSIEKTDKYDLQINTLEKEIDFLILVSNKQNNMELIILESPYAGNIDQNVIYAKSCMRDAILNHNEAPMVSHLLYTQCLDDSIPFEREIGINAGLSFKIVINKTVVYTDYGISKGMQYGINDAIKNGREIEYRKIL